MCRVIHTGCESGRQLDAGRPELLVARGNVRVAAENSGGGRTYAAAAPPVLSVDVVCYMDLLYKRGYPRDIYIILIHGTYILQ